MTVDPFSRTSCRAPAERNAEGDYDQQPPLDHSELPGAERHVDVHHLGGPHRLCRNDRCSGWSTTARVALSLRSRDLASLRVLGFSRREISGILLSELALQVLVALPLGVPLSRWFTAWAASISHPERFRLPDDVSSQRLAFAVLGGPSSLR